MDAATQRDSRWFVNVRTGSGARQVGDAVAEEVKIKRHTIVESATDAVAPSEKEFHAPVAQRRSVKPCSSTLTGGSKIGGIDKHILDIFYITVDIAI